MKGSLVCFTGILPTAPQCASVLNRGLSFEGTARSRPRMFVLLQPHLQPSALGSEHSYSQICSLHSLGSENIEVVIMLVYSLMTEGVPPMRQLYNEHWTTPTTVFATLPKLD